MRDSNSVHCEKRICELFLEVFLTTGSLLASEQTIARKHGTLDPSASHRLHSSILLSCQKNKNDHARIHFLYTNTITSQSKKKQQTHSQS